MDGTMQIVALGPVFEAWKLSTIVKSMIARTTGCLTTLSTVPRLPVFELKTKSMLMLLSNLVKEKGILLSASSCTPSSLEASMALSVKASVFPFRDMLDVSLPMSFPTKMEKPTLDSSQARRVEIMRKMSRHKLNIK